MLKYNTRNSYVLNRTLVTKTLVTQVIHNLSNGLKLLPVTVETLHYDVKLVVCQSIISLIVRSQ